MIFERDPVASVKITNFRGTTGNTATIPNINGSLSSADSLVAGLNQFFSIAGLENSYLSETSKISRVVTEHVYDDE